MKMTMLILAAIVVVCLCFCYVRCRKYDNAVARSICKMVFPGIATVIFAQVMLFTTHRNISILAHSLYFISTGWLLYHLLSYATLYVGEKVDEKIKRPIKYSLLAADAVIMISNIFTEKFFSVTYIIYSDELSYYKFEVSPLFAFHACFVYSLVIFTFIALIYKIFHTGNIYRKKYISVALIVGVIVIANAVFMFLGDAIDFSVLGYAVGGLLIYYYSLEYIPTELKHQTLTLVTDDMTEGLIILDENNECIYMNNCAQRILGVDNGSLKLTGTVAEEWLDIHNLKSYKNTVINYRHNTVSDDRYYKINFNRIEDEKNYYIGSYFFIQDFTAEHRRIDEEHYKATHNGLTGLYTTEHFFDMAEKALREHPDDTYLMICSDISNFKLVNDLVGWEYGNEVLVHIAEAFRMSATPD
ncbi:MAG: diguanylate cyclase, partial [Lachnospiraceae bacterium]|nr:diguanylate cyclase [Lachnospiraceae bacterium]